MKHVHQMLRVVEENKQLVAGCSASVQDCKEMCGEVVPEMT